MLSNITIIQALLTFEHKRPTPLIRFEQTGVDQTGVDQTGVDKLKAWGE
jgi:hypothetical protein